MAPRLSRIRRFTAALGIVAASLAFPLSSSASGPAAAAATGAIDLSIVHIDNFGQINANYFRGAQPEGADYAALARIGVKTVINLTSEDADPNEAAMVEHAGMTYVQIPMTTRVAPTSAQLDEFLKIANDPASQPIYVHCVGGRHRTGVMTAAYRMTADGWTPDRAFAEMKQYRFGADFLHPEFKQFVYGFPAATDATRVASTR